MARFYLKFCWKRFFEVDQTLHSLTDKAVVQIFCLKQLPFKIKIIDAPGFADNKEDMTASEILSNILLFLKELKNGFNIGIFCLPVGTRVDSHDICEIELLSLLMGQGIFNHTIVAVTRGNTLIETQRMETYKKYSTELPQILHKHGLGNLGSEKILFADFDHFDELFMTPFIEILRNTPSYMPQIANDINPEDADSIERFLATPQMQAVCSKYESVLDEQRKQIERMTTEYKHFKHENDKIIALNEQK